MNGSFKEVKNLKVGDAITTFDDHHAARQATITELSPAPFIECTSGKAVRIDFEHENGDSGHHIAASTALVQIGP